VIGSAGAPATPGWQAVAVGRGSYVDGPLADGGFQGPALCDLGYRGKRLAEAGQALGITVEAIARGRDGQFIPAGICWVVERSFA
jgi:hypothetical protein